MSSHHLDADLAELAGQYGVATSYDDWAGRPVAVDADVVRKVLAALGVDASDPSSALRARVEARASRSLPSMVVADHGEPLTVPVPGDVGEVALELESGERRLLGVDESELQLPADLPLGWHRLTATAGGRTGTTTLVVVPRRLAPSAGAARVWGWAVQLYQTRSADSWGMGDYADLATVARWSGRDQGAGVVLVNPLHAMTPTLPVNPSPYYPSSRRFRSPLYLRPELTPEYAAAAADVRARVDALAAAQRAQNRDDTIDRDAVWTAKLEALGMLFATPFAVGREAALAAFRAEVGDGLTDFATFCALAERHGVPWQGWPPELRRPADPAVAQARIDHADRVAFHAWLQLLCDEQLAAAQAAARDAGMPLGVLHDLAVGVDPCGADAWALQDALSVTTTVGAPPDSFNQLGQDWQLPPWRPDRLAELGYAPYRDMLRAVLRHAGGVRIDHVLGLFRLWWIPEGEPPARGAYVSYDAHALLGVLLLEAHRAGAAVVGEDLGTVEPGVVAELAHRGILGSDVLWFARDIGPAGTGDGVDRGPLPPERWRETALASITTHDLPTVAGWLAAEHVRVRAERNLLGRPVAEEQAQADRERGEWLALLHERGLLDADKGGEDPGPSVEDVVVAMHGLLGRTPARIVLATLADAVGDRRQPNLPGTVDEYPSWRLPLADAEGTPLLLEDVIASPLARRIAEQLSRPVSG